MVLGVTRCRLAVRAKSIGRALKIVGRQRPGDEAKVVFVMDPESSSRPSFRTLPRRLARSIQGCVNRPWCGPSCSASSGTRWSARDGSRARLRRPDPVQTPCRGDRARPRAERLWRPLLAANLGLCISHAGIVGIFVTLEHYQRSVEQLKDRSTRECRSPSFVHARS